MRADSRIKTFDGRTGQEMNRIEQRALLAPQGQPAGARTIGGGTGFNLAMSRAVADRAGTTRAGRTAPVSFAAPLDTLVALQATDQATERKRRQTRRGADMLDGLDKLKGALLSGHVNAGDLDRLRGQLSAQREATDDPGLDDVLAHIDLRAAVELAKLGRR